MCDKHSNVLVDIPTASERGKHGRKRGIDECIAPLIDALNRGGIATVASCCGHNTRAGSVVLTDGRELLIFPTFDPGRELALAAVRAAGMCCRPVEECERNRAIAVGGGS